MIKGFFKYTTLYSQIVKNGKINDLDKHVEHLQTFILHWCKYRKDYLKAQSEEVEYYLKTLKELNDFVQQTIKKEQNVINTIEKNLSKDNYLKEKVEEFIKKINQAKHKDKEIKEQNNINEEIAKDINQLNTFVVDNETIELQGMNSKEDIKQAIKNLFQKKKPNEQQVIIDKVVKEYNSKVESLQGKIQKYNKSIHKIQ